MLALAAAPAIVRASSLMKLAPGFDELESGIVVPESTLTLSGNRLLSVEEITNEALRVLGASLARFRVTESTALGDFRRGDIITINGIFKGAH
jgi:hypothetical protein